MQDLVIMECGTCGSTIVEVEDGSDTVGGSDRSECCWYDSEVGDGSVRSVGVMGSVGDKVCDEEREIALSIGSIVLVTI